MEYLTTALKPKPCLLSLAGVPCNSPATHTITATSGRRWTVCDEHRATFHTTCWCSTVYIEHRNERNSEHANYCPLDVS